LGWCSLITGNGCVLAGRGRYLLIDSPPTDKRAVGDTCSRDSRTL
jgi:hypothetical protein